MRWEKTAKNGPNLGEQWDGGSPFLSRGVSLAEAYTCAIFYIFESLGVTLFWPEGQGPLNFELQQTMTTNPT
jgi:hypothetical protein